VSKSALMSVKYTFDFSMRVPLCPVFEMRFHYSTRSGPGQHPPRKVPRQTHEPWFMRLRERGARHSLKYAKSFPARKRRAPPQKKRFFFQLKYVILIVYENGGTSLDDRILLERLTIWRRDLHRMPGGILREQPAPTS
jgi:hypothetical protein